MDRKHVLAALGYGILGILLGIYMASSKNYIYLTVHAHVLLLGFVTSFIYGVCYKLWLKDTSHKTAKLQFLFHQIGTPFFCIGMLLMYSGYVAPYIAGPLIGIGALLVLAGMITMKILFIKSGKTTQNA